MNNTLHALLRIHALRERRALRVLHDQQQAHAQAVQAEADATRTRHGLEARADMTLSAIGAASTTSSNEMRWQLQQADSMKAEAAALSDDIARLAEHAAQLQARVDEARSAHLVQVRGHRKLEEASARRDRIDLRAVSARAEQTADDEFAIKWSASADRTEVA